MDERYRVPGLEFTPKRSWDIPFSGNFLGFTQGTLVSGRITFPFRVTRVRMWFRNDAAYLVLLTWLVDDGPAGSTTGKPPGDNLFRWSVPTPDFIGEDTMIEAEPNYVDEDGDKYLKLHVNNDTAGAQDVMAIATIEEL